MGDDSKILVMACRFLAVPDVIEVQGIIVVVGGAALNGHLGQEATWTQ